MKIFTVLVLLAIFASIISAGDAKSKGRNMKKKISQNKDNQSNPDNDDSLEKNFEFCHQITVSSESLETSIVTAKCEKDNPSELTCFASAGAPLKARCPNSGICKPKGEQGISCVDKNDSENNSDNKKQSKPTSTKKTTKEPSIFTLKKL